MRSLYRALAAIAILSAFSSGAAAQEKRDYRLVEQDRSGYADLFVERSGPYIYDIRDVTDFEQGQLGVLLPSYGRAHLYLAYRALTHTAGELGTQFKNAPPNEFLLNINNGSRAIANWQTARAAVADRKLTRRIMKYRRIGQTLDSYLNCSDSAFNLATDTLQSLSQNKQLAPQDVQDWIAAQDAVFDQCSDLMNAPSGNIPQELTSGASPYLQQLRLYQIAAANFYSANYTEALRRFDQVAANKVYTMRAWANLAAMRTLLRMGSTDDTFSRRVQEIKSGGLPAGGKLAEYDAAAAENRRNMTQLYDKIAARAKLVLADRSFASIHEPTRKLLKQAEFMILPEQAFTDLTASLGRFDKDFRLDGELFLWARIGDRLFDDGARGDLIASLRHQYEYFDWIRTIQGCTDIPWSPNFQPGRCEQEQQHALDRWQASKNKVWLAATLITAQQITPQIERALAAAARVTSKDNEYLTLRYDTARLLRHAGRVAEARAIIDEVMQPPNFGISAGILRNSSSANNLFKQEALALAKTDQQALPYLLRESPRRLGADGDELLNRKLSSEDLLRLAQDPTVDSDLAEQLLVASWWRADMVGKKAVAEQAARLIASRVPNLSAVVSDYLKADNDGDRHFILAKAALHYRISPRIYAVTHNFAAQSKPRDVQFWCSFSSDDYARRALVERTPTPSTELTADAGARDAELSVLRQIGSGADWMGRIALAKAKTTPNDATVQVMLQAVAKSGNRNCGSPDGANLVIAAKQLLVGQPVAESTGNLRVISEAESRAVYDKVKLANAGKQEYHVTHIMFSTEGAATAALASIRGGASFEQAAKASLDIASANKGGDLGWILPGNFAKPFADAVSTMGTPGLYPLPVRTQYGWHVIRVLGTRPYVLPDFEQVRPLIEQQIRKQRPQ